MRTGKVIRKDPFDGMTADLMTQTFVETGGVNLSGRCIELIRTAKGELKLLDSAKKRPAEIIKVQGRSYIPPTLSLSVLENLILPTGRTPCGTTVELFGRLRTHVLGRCFSREIADLFSYFAVATWFADVLPVIPQFVITGPELEARLALHLLRCLVRHALPLGELNRTTLRSLPMHLQPTLVISSVPRSMYSLVSSSAYPGAFVSSPNELLDIACPKVVYGGETMADGLFGETVLRVHLVRHNEKLPVIRPAAMQSIATDLQPRLLDYRQKHLAYVRDFDFDQLESPNDMRVLSKMLSACIVDAPELQNQVSERLQAQPNLASAARWTDPQMVILESLFGRIHGEPTSDRLRVGEITEIANATLKERGETSKLEAKRTGLILRGFGLIPRRDAHGFFLESTAETRRKIHKLVQDHQIDVQSETNCHDCAELFVSSES